MGKILVTSGGFNIVNNYVSEENIEILVETYHPSFLLLGIEGIGKALTTFAFAKEMKKEKRGPE